MILNAQQERILDAIPLGHRNVKSALELCKTLGINERSLREFVSQLRLMRKPIVSNANGYFLADARDPEDIRQLKTFLKVLSAHARTEAKIVDSVSQCLQIPMEGW